MIRNTRARLASATQPGLAFYTLTLKLKTAKFFSSYHQPSTMACHEMKLKLKPNILQSSVSVIVTLNLPTILNT